MANSVDPDQMPQNAASDLGVHCLLRSVCPSILGDHGAISSIPFPPFTLGKIFSRQINYTFLFFPENMF